MTAQEIRTANFYLSHKEMRDYEIPFIKNLYAITIGNIIVARDFDLIDIPGEIETLSWALEKYLHTYAEIFSKELDTESDNVEIDISKIMLLEESRQNIKDRIVKAVSVTGSYSREQSVGMYGFYQSVSEIISFKSTKHDLFSNCPLTSFFIDRV